MTSPSTYRRYGSRFRASAAAVGGGGGGGGTLVSDTFSRAGDTVTLGTADTGQNWEPFGTDSRFDISSGRANPFEAINPEAGQVINAGTANATVQFTQVNAPTQGPGVIFRWVDALNYGIWYGSASAAMRLSMFVAGAETILRTDAVVAPGAGMVYSVSVDAANLITCKRNGTTVATATDATHATGTRYGIGGPCGTSDLFDTFTVTSP